jgi:hypothetical protein
MIRMQGADKIGALLQGLLHEASKHPAALMEPGTENNSRVTSIAPEAVAPSALLIEHAA